LFERVTIHLSETHHAGETFLIEALGNGAENVFIGEANLDGQPLVVPALSHDAITGGGVLRLQMTATPN
jgi:putative alpha-1,2-mannosidase